MILRRKTPLRRRAFATIAAFAAVAGVIASAATLGGITAQSFGADRTPVTSCDTNGVTVSYTLTTGTPSRVTAITVGNLAVPCRTLLLSATVADATGAALSYGSVIVPAATTATIALVNPVLSNSVKRVALLATNGPALPSTPAAPAAAARDSAVTLTWAAPASTAPITSYQVESPTLGLVCTTTAPTVTCPVTGLANGTAYQFRVRAITGLGAGAWSGYVTTTPLIPAPTAFAAAARDQSALLTWVAPAATTMITGYTVQNAAGATVCTTTALTCTVTGLTNGTAYQFRVRATTAGVAGAWTALTAVTPLIPAPGAFAGAARDRNVVFTWTAPATAGSTITGYTVQNPAGATICTTTTLTCTATGLTNGTAYQFRVRATTAGVAGAWSGTITVTPLIPAPGAFVAAARDRAVVLTWTAPATTGTVITGYTVQNPAGTTLCTTTTLTCTITGLTNGTAYQFRVRATTAGVAGAWSGTITSTPALPAPGTPTAVVSDRTVVLTWTAPAAASPILSYTVQNQAGATVCTTAALTCTVTGLTNGTAYQFRVQAATAAGTGNWSAYRVATPVVLAMTLAASCTPIANFPGYRQVQVTNPNVLAQPFTLQQTTAPTQPVTSGTANNGNSLWLVKVTGSATTSYTVRLLSGTATNRTVTTGVTVCP